MRHVTAAYHVVAAAVILGAEIKSSRHRDKQVIFLTPVGEIKVMDILTVHPTPSLPTPFLFSPC